MKTIEQMSKGEKLVGIFFHVDKKATVITEVEPGEFERGDVAHDRAGHMICRAVYDPNDGNPAYEIQYEVTKLLGCKPKAEEVVEEVVEQVLAVEEPAPESDD